MVVGEEDVLLGQPEADSDTNADSGGLLERAVVRRVARAGQSVTFGSFACYRGWRLMVDWIARLC